MGQRFLELPFPPGKRRLFRDACTPCGGMIEFSKFFADMTGEETTVRERNGFFQAEIYFQRCSDHR